MAVNTNDEILKEIKESGHQYSIISGVLPRWPLVHTYPADDKSDHNASHES